MNAFASLGVHRLAGAARPGTHALPAAGPSQGPDGRIQVIDREQDRWASLSLRHQAHQLARG